MPAISVALLSNPQQQLQAIANGLKFSTFVPTLSNVSVPNNLKASYQLCGKYCHVIYLLGYTVPLVWTAPATISLPISPDNVNFQPETPFTIVDRLSSALVGYAFPNITTGLLTLPARTPAVAETIYITGTYLVK